MIGVRKNTYGIQQSYSKLENFKQRKVLTYYLAQAIKGLHFHLS